MECRAILKGDGIQEDTTAILRQRERNFSGTDDLECVGSEVVECYDNITFSGFIENGGWLEIIEVTVEMEETWRRV